MSDDRLRSIAEELLILANRSGTGTPLFPTSNDDVTSRVDPEVLTRLAKAIYQTRQARTRELPAELFGEPAWDILLDLYIQRRHDRRISITSACTGSQVAPTTALRWIATLFEYGLITREEDPLDKRRVFVALSQKGERAVVRMLLDYLHRVRSALGPYGLVKSALESAWDN